MMQFTTQSGRYLVTSHGNGWAYEVTDQETSDTLWFQDADASQFQDETNNFQNEASIAQYFDLLCE